MSQFSPLVEAFLVIEQPRQRVGHWAQVLATLDAPSAPPLAAVLAFYDPVVDHALINLRYDEMALGPHRLSYVVEIALLAEIGMIQPAELSDYERKRFLIERLARCTHQVMHRRDVVGALTELVKQIRGAKPKPQVGLKLPPPIPRAARGDTDDPVLLVPARGTREIDDPPNIVARSTRDDATQLQRPHRAGSEPPQRAGSEPPQRAGSEPPAARTSSRNVIRREPSPVKIRLNSIADVDQEPPKQVTEPYLPTATGPVPSTMIYARYLRSGRWVPARIGALSLKGAALMTGALPRLQDHVDIALAFGAHRALVRGAVVKVSGALEQSSSGTATFSATFELDDAARRQLTGLLTAARAANVTIKPPPPRSTRRFPVDWPVSIATLRGAVKAEALDVSAQGMFVRPTISLRLDETVNFSILLDDIGSPVAGRAKVVRQIGDADARACGLVPGFGLSIVDMGEADRMRWFGFLARIERRADKRVLIGASPERLTELQSTLAAAGYAVTGGTDPGALVQLASADTRPADAVLIDAGWLQNGASASWVESLFSARNVPCVTMHGDPRRARTTIDRLLDVNV